jgi:inosine-uridine nucleoside N-ribohydrolase
LKVELEGKCTRGLPVYGEDIYSGHAVPPGNVDVCIEADAARFKETVFETLKSG